MNRLAIAAAAAALLSCAPLGAAPPSYEMPDLTVERTLDAVVALVRPDGHVYCAGVAIRGAVVTAAHCVDDLQPIGKMEMAWANVGFRPDYDGQRFSATYDYVVAHFDDVQDLAILLPLTVHEPPAEAELSHDGWWVGREVVAIGHPIGLVWSLSGGVVSALREQPPDGPFPGQKWLQVSAPVSPGNSGGGVFNRYGELIGIVSFRIYDPHLAGVVPMETIDAALRAEMERH